MGNREKLVEMLKAVGKDLIDNSENYIPGDTKWLQSIYFSFGFEAGPSIDIPDLDINMTWAQKSVIDILANKGE